MKRVIVCIIGIWICFGVLPVALADGPPQPGEPLPPISLPIPENRAQRAYIGLSDERPFKIPQIKARVVIIGITVDNIPTLFAWTRQMGTLWFPVLADFWPHGAVADRYGVLRSDGISERALFVIDKKGIIRYIDVHDINKRPPLEILIRELEKLSG